MVSVCHHTTPEHETRYLCKCITTCLSGPSAGYLSVLYLFAFSRLLGLLYQNVLYLHLWRPRIVFPFVCPWPPLVHMTIRRWAEVATIWHSKKMATIRLRRIGKKPWYDSCWKLLVVWIRDISRNWRNHFVVGEASEGEVIVMKVANLPNLPNLPTHCGGGMPDKVSWVQFFRPDILGHV